MEAVVLLRGSRGASVIGRAITIHSLAGAELSLTTEKKILLRKLPFSTASEQCSWRDALKNRGIKTNG